MLVVIIIGKEFNKASAETYLNYGNGLGKVTELRQ